MATTSARRYTEIILTEQEQAILPEISDYLYTTWSVDRIVQPSSFS